ncbi:MAG: hypothetical protein ACO1N9_02240 [Flavobacterium sp.]
MTDLKVKSDIVFIGEALPKEDIAGRYRNSSLDAFLAFANTSCGKWMIIDTENKRIVTNPGWAGGYLDTGKLLFSLNLKELASGRRHEGTLEYSEGALSRYIGKGSYYGSYTYPVSTPYRGIEIVKGGVVIDWENAAKKPVVKSYLRSENKYSFEQAMLTTAGSLKDKDVTLLFSGGKDSLSIYVALREQLGADNIRCIFIDQPVTGGAIDTAKQAAKNLNIDLEIIKPDNKLVWLEGSRLDELEDLLTNVLAAPFAPYHAVRLEKNDLNVLIDGQNMDAMLSFDMPKPVSKNIFAGNPAKNAKVYLSTLMKAYPYSESYVNGVTGEGSDGYYSGYKLLRKIAGKSGTVTPQDLAAALIVKETPGAYKLKDGYLKDEVDRFMEISQNGNGFDFRKAWIYGYPALANLLVSTPTEFESVFRFVCQGPFTDTWLKPITMETVFTRKKEVTDFIHKYTGATYTQIAPDHAIPPRGNLPVIAILSHFEKYLNPDNSALLSVNASDKLQTEIRNTFDYYRNMLKAGKDQPFKTAHYELGRFFRLMNLELMAR